MSRKFETTCTLATFPLLRGNHRRVPDIHALCSKLRRCFDPEKDPPPSFLSIYPAANREVGACRRIQRRTRDGVTAVTRFCCTRFCCPDSA
jgi:hypothetical protein